MLFHWCLSCTLIDYACNRNDCSDFKCPQLLFVYSDRTKFVNKPFSLHFNTTNERRWYAGATSVFLFCFELANSLTFDFSKILIKENQPNCVSWRKKCAILDFYQSFGQYRLFPAHILLLQTFQYSRNIEKKGSN